MPGSALEINLSASSKESSGDRKLDPFISNMWWFDKLYWIDQIFHIKIIFNNEYSHLLMKKQKWRIYSRKITEKYKQTSKGTLQCLLRLTSKTASKESESLSGNDLSSQGRLLCIFITDPCLMAAKNAEKKIKGKSTDLGRVYARD